MKPPYVIPLLITLVIALAAALTTLYLEVYPLAFLNPSGPIAAHQRDLFNIALLLGLFALLPIFVLTYVVVMKFRSHDQTSNSPQNRSWQVKPLATWVWAAFVLVVITSLSVVMIKSTYSIDPHQPLGSEEDSLTIRVVALPWKWLFIYPEQEIATVNELVVPINTPLAFELTADAPMSSFWIPKLGGMIYTMEGMVTKLHLMATETGEFEGTNAEINGKGYSGMKFKTKAISQEEFDQWIEDVRVANNSLNQDSYSELAEPSMNNPVQYYSSADPALFGQILAKFNDPSQSESMHFSEHNTSSSH